MRKVKNKRYISIGLVIYIISLQFIINPINIYFNDYFQKVDNTYQTKFKATNHLDLDGPIIIDGNDDWALTAISYNWCSGSGLESDPYIIENLSINGKASGYCFEIKNSDVYFIIRDCFIYNAGGNGAENAGITLRNVSNGTITNNTINDNRNSGISLYNCDHNAISYNNINKSHFCIYLSYSSYNNISNNIAFAWTEPDSNYIRDNQMRIIRSDYNIITRNYLQRGLVLENCDHNLISYNDITQKYWYGMILSGINNIVIENKFNKSGLHVSSNNHIDTSNLVDGKPIYYYTNEVGLKSYNFTNAGQVILINCVDSIISNLTISYATVGVALRNCENIIFLNNTITYNSRYGIEIGSSKNITLLKNKIMFNYYGIFLFYCDNNKILENKISLNQRLVPYSSYLYGKALYLFDCRYNIISKNLFQSNEGPAIEFEKYSSYNLVYYNSFISDDVYDIGYSNKWDNGTIGNFWSDYAGKDLNDDGIGDLPYEIPPYNEPPVIKDYFPIWDDGDDLGPKIFIKSPCINEVFGENAPKYNITIEDQSQIDSMWYTIDDNTKKHFFYEKVGFINQTIWDEKDVGLIKINFYANDTLGHVRFKDIVIIKFLGIVVKSPVMDMVFGHNSPEFNVTIYSLFDINFMWYTLDYGFIKYYFTGLVGYINQEAWISKNDGTIVINFYVNDSRGYFSSTELIIIKDTLPPKIAILSPSPNQIFGKKAPSFTLDIDDPNLQEKWYSFNGGENVTFTTVTQFSQAEWDKLGHRTVLIKFCAKDKARNTNFNEIFVKKDMIPPNLIVHYPVNGSIYGSDPPTFKISVIEENSFTTSYVLLGHIWYQEYFQGFTGTINKAQWDQIPERIVYIFFIVKDEAGNYFSVEIEVIKSLTSEAINVATSIFLLSGGISLVSIIIINNVFKKK